tara:strand:- start:54772 stop:55851 length:1080 start_codon:yes stop_codon:yes gene_type:complete
MVTGSTDFVTSTSDFYEYDPVNDSWTTLTDFPGVGRGYSIGDTWNGKAYMGFGFGDNNDYLQDLWEFDPSTGQWTELTPCPCAERIHPTFVIEDGLLFVGMGNNDIDGNLKDWWEYDIANDSWRQLTDLPGGPRHHPYMFSANGDVYTGLGHGNGPGTVVYDDWYKWDIQNETWTQLNDFPAEGRVAGTQFSIGDRGFVLSGDGDDHGSMPTGEFWEYDHQSDSWTELPPHPGISRWAPGSFTIGNVVYFLAGEVRIGTNSGLKTDMYKFDLDEVVDVDQENLENISIYPNPAENVLNIVGDIDFSSSKLSIINSTGQEVLSASITNEKVDISNLSQGLYFLSIDSGKGTSRRIKFIKE